ncbi:MAG: chaperone modulator CbpM [Gemmatimonadota bacterium]
MSDTGVSVERTVTITELAYCSGCSRDAIIELLEQDLLAPVQSAPEIRFPPDAVERVRRIRRIEMELEVGVPAMGLVLKLLDRIDQLERVLRERAGTEARDNGGT